MNNPPHSIEIQDLIKEIKEMKAENAELKNKITELDNKFQVCDSKIHTIFKGAKLDCATSAMAHSRLSKL